MNENHIKIINIIVHTIIAFVVLSLMFYFVISRAEERSLQQEMDSIMKSIASGSSIQPIVSTDTEKKYKSPDELKIVNNRWLFSTVMISCIALLMIPVCIFLTLKYFCKLSNTNLKNITIHNGLILLFVVSFELYFIFAIGINYIPVDPVHFHKEVDTYFKEVMLSHLE
jgi:hypothetical protein